MQELQKKLVESYNIVRHIDRRHKTIKKRLERFPLWKRIFFYSRFEKIRKRLSDLEQARLGAMLITTMLLKANKKDRKRAQKQHDI